MDFKQSLLNLQEKQEKFLNRVIFIYKLIKNPEKNLFAITVLIFPKHIVILTVLAIQKN